jgi:hypothetical protein
MAAVLSVSGSPSPTSRTTEVFSVGRWGEGQAGGSEAAVDEAGSELDSA